MNSTTDTERAFNKVHIDEDVSDLTGLHENEVFHNCTFRNLRGLTLKDCVLARSKFLTDKLEDAMGLTFTVGDCGTFRDVEYSEYLFDLFLVMMIQTAGNTSKRRRLIEVVG